MWERQTTCLILRFSKLVFKTMNGFSIIFPKWPIFFNYITLPTKVHLVKAMVLPVVTYGCKSWTIRKLRAEELMLLNRGVGEDSWEYLGLQEDPIRPSYRRSVLGVHWKDWCWSWNSDNLATWCEELIHLKRPWCWERLRTGGEGDDRGGWDGWMASPTQRTWVWVNSGSWWWTGKPGVL